MQRNTRFVTLLLSLALTLFVIAGPVSSASLATKALKGAAIGFVVTKAAEPLDKFINGVTFRQGMSTRMDTKVVPILSVGEKGYVGGAQVCGPKFLVDRVNAVFEYEKNFSNNNYRAKVLVPSASLNPLKLERVEKVGITAIIDVALDGGLRYNTIGTGIQLTDAARAAAVLVAVKNMGPGINKALNTVTLNSGASTRVVPWASFGNKTYLGAVQVAASSGSINDVSAVWQYEHLFDNGKFRVKVLVPTTSSNPLKMKRVDGAGVTAIIDMALSQQKDIPDARKTRWGPPESIFGGRHPGRGWGYDDDDRGRRDNGKHKGWTNGKRNGRKHDWVDAKWQDRLSRIHPRDREPFIEWLDGLKNRNILHFDGMYREFLDDRR